MILTKEHVKVLKEIYEGKLRGDEFYSAAEKDPEVLEYLNQLNLMGLLRLEDNDKYHLTYSGMLIAETIEAAEKQGLIKAEDWEEGYRWVGTEVIAMIDVARKCQGRCPKDVAEVLEERGFAKNGQLTPLADTIWQAYQEAKPHITVDKRLTDYIKDMPPGPGLKSILKLTADVGKHELYELEAQRLIAFSAPKSDVYALTGLGQQVRAGLLKSAPALPINVSAEILEALAKVVEEGKEAISQEMFEKLVAQAYIDEEGRLLPGGKHLYLAWKIYTKQVKADPWTVDFDEIEIEILKAIEKIWEIHKENPEIYPTKEEIWKIVFERKLKEAQKLLEKYGRRLKELPEKKQQILKELQEAKKVEDWFNKYYDISTALYSLEAQEAIKTDINEKGKLYYDFTDWGKKVLQDQKQVKERPIPAPAVKSITVTRLEFRAPDYSWFVRGEEAVTTGQGAPTASGRFYARMATHINRVPHLTAFELRVLKCIPYLRGAFIEDDIIKPYFKDEERENVYLALEKLDAKGIVNLETCGVVTLTEPGKLIKRATAGTPEGIANPVNPFIIRIIKAIREVGSLYVKEQRVRIEPENWKEIKKKAGLTDEEFEKELTIMKQAKFLGQNSLFESGLLLLEAAKLMKAEERYWEEIEV